MSIIDGEETALTVSYSWSIALRMAAWGATTGRIWRFVLKAMSASAPRELPGGLPGLFSSILGASGSGQLVAASFAPADSDVFIDLGIDWDKLYDAIGSLLSMFAGGLCAGMERGHYVTLDLTTHFLARGQAGSPLDSHVELVKQTRGHAFLQGVVRQNGEPCYSFSGTLKRIRERNAPA